MKQVVSNKMRHFLKLNPESTTLYFKEHKASMKDMSTMKNALGYKFEKKKDEAKEKAAKSERYDKSVGSFNQHKYRIDDGSSVGYNSHSSHNNKRGWKPTRNSTGYSNQMARNNYHSNSDKNLNPFKQASHQVKNRDERALIQN